MPRELQPPRSPQPPLELTHSPEIATPEGNEAMGILDSDMILDEWPAPGGANGAMQDADVVTMLRRFDENEQLHPYVATLGIGDVDACVALENAAFPENERCSREKFQYRLTACPSLSLGLFTSTTREPDDETRACYEAARAPDSSNPSHKALLIGHVVATMTSGETITDETMGFPPNFFTSADGNEKPPTVPAKDPPPVPRKDALPSVDQSVATPGHHPLGRTLAIHSVCILPPFQHLSLGKILVRGYLQRIEGSAIADTAALISRAELAGWYSGSFGFVDKGTSSVTFGGGGWRDMRYEFGDSTSSM